MINLLTEVLKKIEMEYPDCKIELFYDKENMLQIKSEEKEIVRIIAKLINILCFYKNDIYLYIRIHTYRQWVAVRLATKSDLPKCGADYLKRLNSEERTALMILDEKECQIKDGNSKIVI